MTTSRDVPTPGLPAITLLALEGARSGDPEATERLLARLRPRLERWVAASLGPVLRGHLEVDDVVQMVLQRAWSSLPSFRGSTRAELEAWLFRIAEHRILDERDRLTAQRRDVRRAEPLGQEPASGQRSPSQFALQAEARRALLDRLLLLPEIDRRLICRVHLEGHSYAEAGAPFGLGEKATGARVARALRLLRRAGA